MRPQCNRTVRSVYGRRGAFLRMRGESIHNSVHPFETQQCVLLKHGFLVCLLLFATLGVRARAQVAGLGASRAWFPTLPAAPATDPDLGREVRNFFRLYRRASATDRVELRRQLGASLDRLWPELLPRFTSGNQVDQLPICLTLMNVREPLAVPTLEDLVRGDRKGLRGHAALAYARQGVRGGWSVLKDLASSAKPDERLKAVLAMGLQPDPEAAIWLSKLLSSESQSRMQVAALLAAASQGDASFLPVLQRYLKAAQDPLRRAASLALAYNRAPKKERRELLVECAKDEDLLVRIAGLRGLAWLNQEDDLGPIMDKLKSRQFSSEEEAEWVLARSRCGDAGARKAVEVASRSARNSVRAAAAAGAISLGARQGLPIASSLSADEDLLVAHAGILATIALSGERGPVLGLAAFLAHRHQGVREAAILGMVYSDGLDSREFLAQCLQPRYKDDVRDHARQLMQWLDAYPDAVRQLAWARLQTMLDHEGWSPSWGLADLHHVLLKNLLGLDDGHLRFAGRLAGASGQGSPVPRRISADAEDLLLHLDRYPFCDRRSGTEFPRPGN